MAEDESNARNNQNANNLIQTFNGHIGGSIEFFDHARSGPKHGRVLKISPSKTNIAVQYNCMIHIKRYVKDIYPHYGLWEF